MRAFLVKTGVLIALASYGLSWQSALAARFVDLSGIWSERYINTLSDQGVINAEPDGKFRPNQPITRAVFAYWLVKVLGLENQPVSNKPSFPDVKPTDWCYKPIEIIRQNNYISGYADGFRPNQLIQRAEVMNILSRTLNTPAPDEQAISQALNQYTDRTKIPAWAKAGVAQDTIAGIMIGPDPHFLNPMNMATRGDTAAMLSSLRQYLTHQSIKDETDQASQVPAINPAAGQSGNYPPTMPSGPPPGTMAQQPYGAPGYSQQYQDNNQFKGRVQEQTGYQQQQQNSYPPPQQSYAPPGQYMQPQTGAQPAYPPQNGGVQGGYPGYPQQNGGAQGGYPPQTAVVPNGYPPLQGQSATMGGYPPTGPMLQGSVTTVAAGTKFDARLKNTLDSGSTQPGEPVEASLNSPIYSGGVEAVPAGSKLIGQVTNVVSAKRFKFGANGKIEIKFTQVETPDGRKFPLTASIDDSHFRLVGGSTAGRIGKGLLTTGVGAGSGAVFGTALGAIVGATSGGGNVGRSTGMGAVFGTALGGGAGLIGAGVRKGSEIKITAGTELPVQLEQSLQIAGPPIMPQQPYGAPYQQGGYPPQSGYPAPNAYPQGGAYQEGYPQAGYPQ